MRDLAARLTAHTEGLLLLVILLLGALLTVLSPYFLTLSNVVDLIESYSVTTVLALGVFVVLVAGGIDISFAATASVAQYVTAYVATAWGLPAPLCIALGPAGRPGAGLPQRGADLLSARHLDHHHHRHHERLLRAPDVADRRQVDLRPARLVVDARRALCRPRPPNGDLVRITLPILVAALAALADLAADDPHRPPAGSSPPWAATPRPRAGWASTSAPCISWPTAISA